MKINSITKGALFLILFFISSNLIPTLYVLQIPFTFQTLVILLIPFYFNLKEIVIWYICLLFMCLIGIPIMANYSSGLSVLIGPTAGFIYGWLIKMIVINKMIRYNRPIFNFFVLTIATIIDLLCGSIYLSILTNANLINTTITIMISFLPFGLVKNLFALIIVARLNKTTNIKGA